MRLTDLDIIDKAAKLIRDKFKIGLIIAQCSIEAGLTYLSIDPQLKINLTTTKDHDG